MKLNMPEPEPKETKTVEQPAVTVENTEPPPPREISQTDHLNKKLLTSLFKRMDDGGDSLLSKMLEPDETNEGDDEWES